MIDVGISQKNSCDGTVARRLVAGLQSRQALELPRQIGRCVNQEPALGIAAGGDAGLRLWRNLACLRGDAVRTGTVPLRQTAAGCASENLDANQPKLRSIRPVRSHRARV